MKKIIYLILILFLNFSCEEKKIEFVQSKVLNNVFLIKHYPSDNVLLKGEISLFLIKDYPENVKSGVVYFYKYTSDSEYFLDHLPDSGGFSSYELEDIEDQNLANFFISKCKNDTTKLVGKFHYYGINQNLSEIDTLIYKCN
ncbi:hypothetical protein [Flavobacterium hibernum]|uniref:Lipoprotein n=1 Tax=Flavobacterium hibernum TaxID=37752 RepID=A0ABX4CD83_9FLAO|nr:hypothetical protein [Flavobacterium hibernum]OXA91700.1 hypothetical protein B0A73_00215 [Flavobacterium hibernum]PTS99865.1 hypothetical protein DBR27_13170 [Flavobacterium sp. HMWF030]STO09813.1 Uncharacterised protein [Flavobacterium hibernum]